MIKKSALVVVLIGLAVPAVTVRACPVCDQETGRQVRAGIFDEEFGRNLLVTMLPFAIFLGIVAAIHSGGPRPNHERSNLDTALNVDGGSPDSPSSQQSKGNRS